MKLVRIAAIIFLLQEADMFACAFHEFPPFGADWYHESVYRMIYNSELQRGAGVSYTMTGYSKTFLIEPELPSEAARSVLTKELIAHRYLYYKFSFNDRLSCLASLAMTDIRSQALADDGPVVIGSSSAGQLSFFLTYKVPIIKMPRKVFEINFTGGIQSAKLADNVFYSHIGWLKYQWDKISPRLIAGNYTETGTLACSPVYKGNVLRVYSGVSTRFFAFNKEGFKYGTDFNLFLTGGYKAPFRNKSFSVELIAGPFFEKSLIDAKKYYCTKEEGTFANGSTLSLIAGGRITYRNISAGLSVFKFLNFRDFTEFQLYPKTRNTFYIHVSF